ncbi:methyltransferase domain-containing protein [Pseudomonas sp. IT-P2]|uniref:methyltransferase domain-containing protein n=1 Tax=Pseudomonas sp. IT-P2 TaxID=3026456 RepID=UPI0039E0C261
MMGINSIKSIFIERTGVRRLVNAVRKRPAAVTEEWAAAQAEASDSDENPVAENQDQSLPPMDQAPSTSNHEQPPVQKEELIPVESNPEPIAPDSIASKHADPIPEFPRVEPGSAIKVLFVAQHPSIWPSWRSIWQTMADDPQFVAKVVLSPMLHPYSSAAVTIDNMRRSLIEEGVPFCTTDALNLESFRPHVVFLQNPYDETRPGFLTSEELVRAGCRIAYVPYGLEMGGGAWNLTAQFDLPFHRTAWRIFARSERHKRMFAKYCRSGNSHVVVTGHPKFDSINTPHSPIPSEELERKIGGRKVVLWTPHFSVTEIPSWSTYLLYGDAIFSVFDKHQDLFLILRPHPLFFKSLVQNQVMSDEEVAQLKEKINKSNNIALDESADYQSAFFLSDGLMTDVGSFLLEYLPTHKPILYLHHPDGLGMNDDESLTKLLYTANSAQDIDRFITNIKDNIDTLQNERCAVITDYLFGLDGHIGARICQNIATSLYNGDIWFPRLNDESSALQQRSETYWKNATTTFLAPPDYYERKLTILDEELPQLASPKSAMDIGCGDGKFTLQLANHVQRMQACDISEEFIEKARSAALAAEVNNVTFSTQELEQIAPFEKFDLVSCMGVTSCIIDDSKFIFFLQKLHALVKNHGHLLMIDTLSTTHEQSAEDPESGYLAKYRSIEDYRLLFNRAGFTIKKERVITDARERNLTNNLIIMQPSGVNEKT